MIKYTLSDKINLYPNPTSGKFSIDLENDSGLIELSIRDIYGRLGYSENVQNKNRINIELNQDAGIYFLMLKSAEGILVQKIVKQ